MVSCQGTKGGNASNLAKHLEDRHLDHFKELKVNEFQLNVQSII